MAFGSSFQGLEIIGGARVWDGGGENRVPSGRGNRAWQDPGRRARRRALFPGLRNHAPLARGQGGVGFRGGRARGRARVRERFKLAGELLHGGFDDRNRNNEPMHGPKYAIGQAVFIRTDTPDYAEETVPFKTLEELVRVCSQGRANLMLEKVIVYSMVNEEPCALTLGFISASQGQRPGSLELLEN